MSDLSPADPEPVDVFLGWLAWECHQILEASEHLIGDRPDAADVSDVLLAAMKVAFDEGVRIGLSEVGPQVRDLLMIVNTALGPAQEAELLETLRQVL